VLGWAQLGRIGPVHIDLVHVHNRPKRRGTPLMTGQHATRRSVVVNGIIVKATKFGLSAKGSLRARTPTDPSPDDATVGGRICTEGAARRTNRFHSSPWLRTLSQVNGRPNAI